MIFIDDSEIIVNTTLMIVSIRKYSIICHMNIIHARIIIAIPKI